MGVRLPTNRGLCPHHNLFTRSHRLLSCTRGNNMFPRNSKGVAGCINRRSHNRHSSSPNCNHSNMHLRISMYRDHGEMLPGQRVMARYNHIQRAGRLAAIIPRPGCRQVVALTAGGVPGNMVRCQIPAIMEVSGSPVEGSGLWWSRLVIELSSVSGKPVTGYEQQQFIPAIAGFSKVTGVYLSKLTCV